MRAGLRPGWFAGIPGDEMLALAADPDDVGADLRRQLAEVRAASAVQVAAGLEDRARWAFVRQYRCDVLWESPVGAVCVVAAVPGGPAPSSDRRFFRGNTPEAAVDAARAAVLGTPSGITLGTPTRTDGAPR